ncbi:MAG: hypothetical protein RML72_04965, partial [Bacteroidia bacterium]|nr:hypothetical protein [Bacteroidia bacterium]MDW8158214.1 hypothetical protein [Bacteroidia bacterium]
ILENSHPHPLFLTRELKELQQHFNKIEVKQQSGKTQVDPKSGITKVGGTASYIFDNATIESIRTKAGDIRKKIVLCQITST